MKKTFRLLTLLILFALLFVPAGSAQAQGPNPNGEGQVIFGSNYTVKSGDTFNGDLVVFGGNVTVEKDARVNGDLVVIGGTITSNGETSGSVVAVGGQISLEESARVTGDVVTIGGQLNKAESAEVTGQIVNNAAPNISVPTGRIPPPTEPEVPYVPRFVRPSININYNPFGEFMWVFGVALLAGLVGILGTLFFRDHLNRVSYAAMSQPLMTGSIGLLSIVVLFLAAITIILLPLAFVGLLGLAFAWLFGVVSLGQEIGERLARALRQDWTPVIATGLGTFVLVFIVASFQALDNFMPLMACVTWVVPAMIGLLAVGAVVITRFGTRPLQTPALAVYTPNGPGQDGPVG